MVKSDNNIWAFEKVYAAKIGCRIKSGMTVRNISDCNQFKS